MDLVFSLQQDSQGHTSVPGLDLRPGLTNRSCSHRKISGKHQSLILIYRVIPSQSLIKEDDLKTFWEFPIRLIVNIEPRAA